MLRRSKWHRVSFARGSLEIQFRHGALRVVLVGRTASAVGPVSGLPDTSWAWVRGGEFTLFGLLSGDALAGKILFVVAEVVDHLAVDTYFEDAGGER